MTAALRRGLGLIRPKKQAASPVEPAESATELNLKKEQLSLATAEQTLSSVEQSLPLVEQSLPLPKQTLRAKFNFKNDNSTKMTAALRRGLGFTKPKKQAASHVETVESATKLNLKKEQLSLVTAEQTLSSGEQSLPLPQQTLRAKINLKKDNSRLKPQANSTVRPNSVTKSNLNAIKVQQPNLLRMQSKRRKRTNSVIQAPAPIGQTKLIAIVPVPETTDQLFLYVPAPNPYATHNPTLCTQQRSPSYKRIFDYDLSEVEQLHFNQCQSPMKVVSSNDLQLLRSGQRTSYLQSRYERTPVRRYNYPEATSWRYGWFHGV